MAFVSGDGQTKLVGYEAAADYSAITNQYKFVYISTAEAAGTPGQVTLCTSATTQKPIGVLQNTPKTGLPAEVVVIGATKISVGAANSGVMTAGDDIGHDASAQAQTYVPGTDTTKYISGRVIETSSAQNQIISAIINCATPLRAA